MIPNPERGNPYLHDVGIDRDILMSELSLDDKGRYSGFFRDCPKSYIYC